MDDDVHMATALASCHNLKTLTVDLGHNVCVFGRNGLKSLQALVTGCPLLSDVELHLTVPGIHFLGTHYSHQASYLETHCTHQASCDVLNMSTNEVMTHPQGFSSIEELNAQYPAVRWTSN